MFKNIFKKKNIEEELLKKDIEIIKYNSKTLLFISRTIENIFKNETIAREYEKLADTVQYFNPSADKKIMELDEDIYDQINIMKSFISRSNSVLESNEFERRDKKLKLLVNEREGY